MYVIQHCYMMKLLCMPFESKINVPVCHFVIDKHVNSWNKLFIVVTFMKTFCGGVTFYPNTASNYTISIILRCFMNN